jgi:hypothetical protein
VFSGLPSRLGAAIATGRAHKQTAATTALHTTTPQHPRPQQLAARIENTRYALSTIADTMDENSIGNGDVLSNGAALGAFPPMSFNGMPASVMTG